jgi:hypothetical protein
MAFYRKKPVSIEAFQWNGGNILPAILEKTGATIMEAEDLCVRNGYCIEGKNFMYAAIG